MNADLMKLADDYASAWAEVAAWTDADEAPRPSACGQREELERHIDALLKDAERYRWLRARIPGGTYRVMGVIYSEGGPGVDAAIDAAMAGEGKST